MPGTYFVQLNVFKGYEQAFTSIEVTVQQASELDIPTLDQIGLVLLSLTLLAAALVFMRRQSRV